MKGRDYMSNNNYILNLLNIEDPNIHISQDSIDDKVVHGVKHKVIYGVLSYIPSSCPCCNATNSSSNDIIKWGFKHNCKVIIPKISNFPSILFLSKQRFFCKHCHNTFVAATSLVDRYKNISNNSNLLIRTELMTKSSEKDIAFRANVSSSSVNRILHDISTHSVLRHPYLPTSMNWDEFKATKDTKGKMAFMILDNQKGNIFDILDSRKSLDLEKYFERYSRRQRNKVQFISTDFYSGYISLANKLFRNASIVIDRFHIVVQAYQALNITRVKLCHKSNPNYNKLKYYWKLLLKNELDLTDEKHYSKHFRKEISQKEIVTYLIHTDSTLKATYECYQGLIQSIHNKDFQRFQKIIHHPTKDISDKMKQALKLYRQHEQYIENSFKYDINNGIIEGTNNLIKCVKRIAFGYRSFTHFTSRIFLIKGIIKG